MALIGLMAMALANTAPSAVSSPGSPAFSTPTLSDNELALRPAAPALLDSAGTITVKLVLSGPQDLGAIRNRIDDTGSSSVTQAQTTLALKVNINHK